MVVSCLILNYNDSKTTLELLNKIKDYKILNYILIIDNCSRDNSCNILCDYRSSEVHVLQTDKNGGYGYGNNFGIRYAYDKLKSDYVVIANPDVEFSEGCVQTLCDFLSENKNYCTVSCIQRDGNGRYKEVTAWPVPSVAQYVFSASQILNKIFKFMTYKDGYFNGESVDVDCVPGSFLIVDTELMLKYGMYDEDIFLYCEETTLGKKLKDRGYKTALVLIESYIHHHSVSIDKEFKSDIKKRKLLIQSRCIFLKKYYRLSSIRMFLIKCFYKFTILEYAIIQNVRGF